MTRHSRRSPPPAPTRVDYGCGHSELMLPGAALPSAIHAPHLCPACAGEELDNPFTGEFGFHLHAIRDRSAEMLPGWIAGRQDALQFASALAPTHPAITVQACAGPRGCPQADHGRAWVDHIARLACLHEAHGDGWSAVTIDDYDAALARQQGLPENR